LEEVAEFAGAGAGVARARKAGLPLLPFLEGEGTGSKSSTSAPPPPNPPTCAPAPPNSPPSFKVVQVCSISSSSTPSGFSSSSISSLRSGSRAGLYNQAGNSVSVYPAASISSYSEARIRYDEPRARDRIEALTRTR
jgi:hypothetical protein